MRISDKRAKALAYHILHELRNRGILKVRSQFNPIVSIPSIHIESLEFEIARAIKSHKTILKKELQPHKFGKSNDNLEKQTKVKGFSYGFEQIEKIKQAYKQLQKRGKGK